MEEMVAVAKEVDFEIAVRVEHLVRQAAAERAVVGSVATGSAAAKKAAAGGAAAERPVVGSAGAGLAETERAVERSAAGGAAAERMWVGTAEVDAAGAGAGAGLPGEAQKRAVFPATEVVGASSAPPATRSWLPPHFSL